MAHACRAEEPLCWVAATMFATSHSVTAQRRAPLLPSYKLFSCSTCTTARIQHGVHDDLIEQDVMRIMYPDSTLKPRHAPPPLQQGLHLQPSPVMSCDTNKTTMYCYLVDCPYFPSHWHPRRIPPSMYMPIFSPYTCSSLHRFCQA